jgi:glutamine cyclotransferase
MSKYQLRSRPSVTTWRRFAPPFLIFCALLSARAASAGANTLGWRVLAQHPHDARSFTQGLAFDRGHLIESSGRYGASAIALVAPRTGALLRRRGLAAEFFGEGLTFARGRIVQLTWRSGAAFIHDADTLAPRGTYSYAGEGWGLAFDGSEFLMSDGSARIVRRRADSFDTIGAITVVDDGRPVQNLNELEWARGWLYANVWHSDRIAIIDPQRGTVRAWLDLSSLQRKFKKPADWNPAEHVLNGIAFDPGTGHFYVTGKCWPALFELEIETPPPP